MTSHSLPHNRRITAKFVAGGINKSDSDGWIFSPSSFAKVEKWQPQLCILLDLHTVWQYSQIKMAQVEVAGEIASSYL